jgi:Tfp pilus assembly protein PilO
MYSRVVVLVGLVLAAVITSASDTPATLPQVALSSAGLFHLERIVALLAGYVGIVVLVTRAWSGQLPSELSTQGLKYSETADTTAAVFERAAERLETARAELADMRERVEALEKQA